MGDPSTTRGRPMADPWTMRATTLYAHSRPIGDPWDRVVYPWVTHEGPVGDPWMTHGRCIRNPWTTHEVALCTRE